MMSKMLVGRHASSNEEAAAAAYVETEDLTL
jgi:hypothetical protein